MYLTQPLHRALQQRPDHPMTICGDRVRTTREVADRVARLAAAFQNLGVRAGDRVGILSQNSDRLHESLFAIWWVGAVAHPINTRWSPAEMAYAIGDSSTEALLVDDAFASIVPELRERCPGLRTVVHCGDGPLPEGMLGYEALVAGFEPAADVREGGDELALLLYTGGTTGHPKGVMVTHRGMLTSLLGTYVTELSPEPGGVTLNHAPMFHIAALSSWHAQNLVGGTQVFLPGFSPEGFLGAVQAHRVTTSILVPTMVQMVCEHPAVAEHDLSSLTTIIYGAAASSDSVLELAMRTFPAASFTQGYGMTETGVLTVLGREEHIAGGPRLRSVGRACAHVELAVVDREGRPLPVGAVGEIVTRGDHVMAGYWGKPEQTEKTVRHGWMHTGDGGYIDVDGFVYLTDRLKDMIISGGENVYSAEVENALASHPAVAASAVIGLPDPKWGERVHAVVVLRPGHLASADDLRAHAKKLIAGYKVPRAVEFVDALPLSPTGKVLKRELREARIAVPA